MNKLSDIGNIKTALSNHDLNHFIKETDDKGVNIVETRDIKPNTDIEEIFKDRGHCVLFYGPRSMGHWIATLRTPKNEIYFIDSFGEHPNHYSKNIMKCYKNNGCKNVYINKRVLQNEDSYTCGRYTIILTTMHKLGIDPSDMIDFLLEGSKKYKSVDNFIFDLTKEL